MKNEYFNRLIDVHAKFLESEYFSVLSIITPSDCWLSVDMNEGHEEEIADEALERGITNVVVTKDGRLIGSINYKDLWNREWSKLVELEKYMVSLSTPLHHIVDRMISDAEDSTRKRNPLYFAYDENDKEKKIVGIFTFWDLNRGPAYTLSYLGLQYIENTLLIKIRDSHKVWSDHETVLDKINESKLGPKSKKRIKKVFGCNPFDFGQLSNLGLEDLITFYEEDDHVGEDWEKIPENLLKAFKEPSLGNYRNRIGHTVKLLVSDTDNFKDDLKKLGEAWKAGREIFLNFKNPKVRYAFSDPCDF